MQPLREHLDAPLYWIQPKTLSRHFELRTDDATLGRLDFETAFGSLATARTASRAWSLKRVGFFKPLVTVRVAGTETNIALYRPRWTGTEGEIELEGHRYTFKVSNFWATQFEIRDSLDRLVVSYGSGAKKRRFGDLFRTQAVVHVYTQGLADATVELLVLLGWYLIVLHNEDASAVAASAAATS